MAQKPVVPVALHSETVKRFIGFIRERHSIYTLRQAGKPKPWTKNEILQRFRFCNVYRELDKVTQWIRKNWREPYANDPDLWFAMVVARLVNWPETLETLTPIIFKGGKVSWRQDMFIRAMHIRRKNDEQMFGGAYIVSTNGMTMDKAEYLAKHVLTPLWEHRVSIRPKTGDFLWQFHERLGGYIGMGSFMAGQVVADLKYHGVLKDARDWNTWAAPGPGSKRGLNRVCGRDIATSWRPHEWLMTLHRLKDQVDIAVYDSKLPPIHSQDLQNCLCEFDKYERVRLNEGRPRSTYPGR